MAHKHDSQNQRPNAKGLQKKVLMIAYFFPPLGGSGVQRTLKFVKYLPLCGWQPIVSTVKKGHNFAYDARLLEEIPPEAKVYRSHSGETLWLRKIIERLTGGGTKEPEKVKDKETAASPVQSPGVPTSHVPTAQMSQGTTKIPADAPENFRSAIRGDCQKIPDSPAPSQAEPVPPRLGLKQRLFNFIDDYLFIPDSKVRWLPAGTLSSLRAARSEKVDVIFSSSYPYTVHLIALFVHRLTGKPWIADFRDPWVGNQAMEKDIPFRKSLDAWLERHVVRHASYVINVTPVITAMYKKRYPEFAQKMITITNGFDPEDFAALEPIKQERFTLIHTGIIAESYDMETFVQGIELFLEENPTARSRFQCLFIGYVPPRFAQLLKERLSGVVAIMDYMPHKVCLKFLAGAHLLFMTFDRSVDNAYSGKLFDYLGTGRPILGLLPRGIAAELIESKGVGTVVDLGDALGLARAMREYYISWSRGEALTTDSPKTCAEFSRISLTKDLARLLDQVSPTQT